MTDRLEQLWASWRGEYVTGVAGRANPVGGCILCGVLDVRHEHPDRLVHVGERAGVVLNAFPYTSGHVMVLPFGHHARLAELDTATKSEVFDLVDRSVAAIEVAYSPHGVNFGANLGEGSGAGIPEHLHIHVLPRWTGDTNFMTTIGGARVIPEDLDSTLGRLRDAFV